MKQSVFTIVNLKERSQLPIDEKSLRLSASAVYNESCLSCQNNKPKVTPLEEAFFRLLLKKHSVLAVMFVYFFGRILQFQSCKNLDTHICVLFWLVQVRLNGKAPKETENISLGLFCRKCLKKR
ncbi:hypothetical protein DMA11_08070 [Marinilabiliaceae bacterium JC017]|nr:hypothetical protein DMA11_08070 [Marinilabiliaceae bacterium JC017]